jgi:hypothetical protein
MRNYPLFMNRCLAITFAVVVVILSALAFTLSAQEHNKTAQTKRGSYATPEGVLFDNIYLLMDLDAGDVQAARSKLNDRSMQCILGIMESTGFSTNREDLANQPGLRAAAKYWGGKPLPAIPIPDEALRLEMSNRMVSALSVVREELEKHQLQKKRTP